MNRSRRLALALIFVALPVAALSAAEPVAPVVPPAMLAPINAHTPGLVILVARGDKIIAHEAAGSADLEQGQALTTATRFHVASVSKQFTAAAVLLLAREGKLQLDEPARTYLPELPDAYAAVTVRQLLSHTSGLRDQWDLHVASGGTMTDLITQDRLLALVHAQRGLNFTPGSAFRYSNSGFALAAEIVARLSGMPFARFVQERLFQPIGMTSSQVYDDAGVPVPGRAQSYSGGNGMPVRLSRLNYSNYGATSVFSTAADLFRWARELRNPRVLDAAIVSAMAQPTRLNDGSLSSYGLGLYQGRVRGSSAIMHSGSDAGFRTVLAIHPAEDTTIIVLSNGSADVSDLHGKLVEAFLGGAPEPATVAAPPTQDLVALAGYYVGPWGPGFELHLRDGLLERRRPGGPAQPATYLADRTIRFANPDMRLRPDGPDVLQLISSSDAPIAHRRTARELPSTQALQALAGRYRSEELDQSVSVGLSAAGLTMSSLRQPEPVQLVAASRDWFDFPQGRMHFERDGSGRVTGFTLTLGRSRDLRFLKVAA